MRVEDPREQNMEPRIWTETSENIDNSALFDIFNKEPEEGVRA